MVGKRLRLIDARRGAERLARLFGQPGAPFGRIGLGADAHLEGAGGRQPAQDVGHRALEDDASAGDHIGPAAQSDQVGEDVGSKQERAIGGEQPVDQLAQAAAGGERQTGGGRVEDQQPRLVQQRFDQAQPPFLLAAERFDKGLALVGQFGFGQQTVDARPDVARFDAAGAREEVQIFPDAQVVVGAQNVGHVADAGADRVGLAEQVLAGDGAAAAGGTRQGRQRLEQGGLARADGSDQADALARTDLDGNVAEDFVAVDLKGQVGSDDGRAVREGARAWGRGGGRGRAIAAVVVGVADAGRTGHRRASPAA